MRKFLMSGVGGGALTLVLSLAPSAAQAHEHWREPYRPCRVEVCPAPCPAPVVCEAPPVCVAPTPPPCYTTPCPPPCRPEPWRYERHHYEHRR